jgi:hypothetical protein
MMNPDICPTCGRWVYWQDGTGYRYWICRCGARLHVYEGGQLDLGVVRVSGEEARNNFEVFSEKFEGIIAPESDEVDDA